MNDVVKQLRHGGFTIRDIDAACGRIEALEHELAEAKRERDEALNELDAVYAALGTSDAEGAPEAAVTIESIFCERDALQARVERLEKALRGIEVFPITHPDNQDAHNLVLIARAALAADGENNDSD